AVGPGGFLLGRLLLLRQVLGQLQRQRVTNRHRLVAAHDHEVFQALDERRGDVRIDRGRALVDRADQPARPVDADEPDVGEAFGSAYPRPQLSAVDAVDLLGGDAVVEQLLADFRPYLVPNALGTRRGEDPELQPALP